MSTQVLVGMAVPTMGRSLVVILVAYCAMQDGICAVAALNEQAWQMSGRKSGRNV